LGTVSKLVEVCFSLLFQYLIKNMGFRSSFVFLFVSLLITVVAAQFSRQPTFSPTIYMVNIESGYLVGMTSQPVFPIITVVPFFIFLVAVCICCGMVGGAEPFSLGWPGFLLGLAALFFSSVQFGVGVAAYSELEKPRVGSWWIGLACFVSLTACLMAKTRRVAACGSALLVGSFLIGIICTIGDGLYYSHVLKGVQSCANIDGEVWSIDSDYEAFALQCRSQELGRDLSCIHRDKKLCYYFVGITDGDYFFNRYQQLFLTGFCFEIILMAFLFVYMCYLIGNLLMDRFVYQSPEDGQPDLQDVDIEEQETSKSGVQEPESVVTESVIVESVDPSSRGDI
jgi:hypothetical protein